MKTFKCSSSKKVVTWSLVVVFSFLQIIPTGWAAGTPVRELRERSVSASVDALAKTEAASQPAPASRKTVGFVDSTAFQLNENPLSPATPELSKERENAERLIEPLRDQSGIKLNGPVVPANGTLAQTPEPVTQTAEPFNIPEPPKTLELTPVPPQVIDPSISPASEDHGNTMTVTSTVTTVPPRDTKVITDPAADKGLSVTINDRGIATVRWGDQEYKGYFDRRTNSVILITNDDSIWTLKFANKEDGSLYLQSFHASFWSPQRSSDETYAFNTQGQLTRKDWYQESNPGKCPPPFMCVIEYWDNSYRSGGTIDYVHINGKTLISHEKTWSENGGMIGYGYNLTRPDVSKGSAEYWKPNPSNRSESESFYAYDGNGNLLAKNWNSTNGYGGSSFGQEIYVHINGRDLLSVSRSWRYGQFESLIGAHSNDPINIINDPAEVFLPIVENMGTASIMMPPYFRYTSYHSETYYNYDSRGNMLAEVSAWERYTSDGQRKTGGSYSIFDAQKKTWIVAYAEGINNWEVRSVKDWRIIDQAAQRKTVYVGGSVESRWNYTHQVEYARNADGTMTAKTVYDNANNVFSIVQGEPDVLSGGTDDIKFVNGQQVNGHYVYYHEHGSVDENGNWVDAGFRLIFYDQNTWNATTVDFPAQDTVRLGDVDYQITIDENGKIELLQIERLITPEEKAIASYLGIQTYEIVRLDLEHYSCSGHLACSFADVWVKTSDGNVKHYAGMLAQDLAAGQPDSNSPYTPPVMKNSVILLLETAPQVTGRALHTIAEALGMEIESLMEVKFEMFKHAMRIEQCDFAGCEVPLGSLYVVAREGGQAKRYFEGKLAQIARKEYRVDLEEVDPPEVRAAKAVVAAGLRGQFDWSEEEMADYLNRGLIVITVDLSNLTAVAKLDPSLRTYVNALDPFGERELPKEIRYELAIKENYIIDYDPTLIEGEAPSLTENDFYIRKAEFELNGKRITVQFEKQYRDMVHVRWPQRLLEGWKVSKVSDKSRDYLDYLFSIEKIEVSDKVSGKLHKVITYEWPANAPTVTDPSGEPFNMVAHIEYFNGSQGDIKYRDVTWVRFPKGLLAWGQEPESGDPHISVITDQDENGNVLAASKFNYYLMDCPAGCIVTLHSITRTDADGNPLSTIDLVGDGTAKFVSKGGHGIEIRFSNLEDLLNQAAQLEVGTKIEIPGLPEKFRGYIDAIAVHFNIRVEDIVRVDRIEPGMVCMRLECPAWAVSVELTAVVDGKEVSFSGTVNGPRWWDAPFVLVPLQSKGLPSFSSESGVESSLESEAATVLPPALLQSSPIRSLQLKKTETRSALRSLVSPKFQADSSALPAYQQASSLKASPLFGFERSMLFWNTSKELTQ